MDGRADCRGRLAGADCRGRLPRADYRGSICRWSIAEGRLPRVDCRGSIAEGRLPRVDCRGSIAEGRLPRADCRGPIAEGRLPRADGHFLSMNILTDLKQLGRVYDMRETSYSRSFQVTRWVNYIELTRQYQTRLKVTRNS